MSTVAFANVKGDSTRPLVQLDKRRRRLSTIVARHAPKNRPYIVSVHRVDNPATVRPTDDTVRLRAQWKDTLVGQNQLVLLTVLPLGSSSGGAGGSSATTKSVGMALAAVALAIAAPGIGTAVAGALGAGTLGGQLIAAGMIVGKIWRLS
jgi:hypothetical protein